MKSIYCLVVLAMCVWLAACGGGSSSGTESNQFDQSSNETESAEGLPISEEVDLDESSTIDEPLRLEDDREPLPEYASTSELVAESSFLLEPEYELTIRYESPNSSDGYLSICTEFELEGAITRVDYDSCILRTSINGDYLDTLSVPNDKTRLVMAVWFFDMPESPEYNFWEKSEVNDSLLFAVNSQ